MPVAAYCRVSSDKEDQANSFEAQKRYFREYIQHHPEWQLYEIYADEGITGTSTKKRAQFNRMIRDAHEGKFRLILTKEVSRFSRNILDTIAYARELKGLGIGVRFVNDGIDTLEPDAELRLSIMASIAQEESRRTSSRVVWGQTRQMERGIVFGPSMLGYDVKNGTLSINPEGAKIVRIIFQKYALEQMGTSEIARYLMRHGFETFFGNKDWKPNTIIKILKNEKYAGDLVQKKSYTPDYLTHDKKTNHGQVPLITIRNHHEPIIEREIWEIAQTRLQKNSKHQNGTGGHSNLYLFSGKIVCGECGCHFVGGYKYRKDGSKIRRWSCAASNCDVGKLLREDDAIEMLKAAVASLPVDSAAIGTTVIGRLRHENEGTDDTRVIRSEMNRVQRKKETMMDSFFSGTISKEDMQIMNQKYVRRMEALKLQLQETENVQIDDAAIMEMIKAILKGERQSDVFCKTILDSITVYKDRHMELRLNGLDHVFWFEEL